MAREYMWNRVNASSIWKALEIQEIPWICNFRSCKNDRIYRNSQNSQEIPEILWKFENGRRKKTYTPFWRAINIPIWRFYLIVHDKQKTVPLQNLRQISINYIPMDSQRNYLSKNWIHLSENHRPRAKF